MSESTSLAASNPATRTVASTQSEMTEIILPNDTNTLGNLLGGKVMHLVDIAGAMAAMRHARKPVVTASFDHMNFLHPIRIGQLIVLHSQVNRVFHTSMEVGVKVMVEDLMTGRKQHTCSAYLTFVALDAQRRPTAIPPAIPETEEEQRRYREAGERREIRLAMRKRNKG